MNKPIATDSERRRSRRQRPKPRSEAACRPGDTVVVGVNLAVAILDISADGIRLMVKEPLPVGQKIEVDLEGIGYSRTLKLNAEVVWCLEAADGHWCLGAKF
jgi:hypothetical protein